MSPHRLRTGLVSVRPSAVGAPQPWWVRLIPLVLIPVTVGLDFCLPQPWSADVLLALSSMAAACLYSVPGIVLVALLNSFAGVILALYSVQPTGPAHAWLDYGALVVLFFAAVPLGLLRDRLRTHLQVAWELAEATQNAVLPPVRAWLGRVWIAVEYEAASTAAAVGGDLYAAELTPWGVRLLIGDVRGKGLDAIPGVAALVGCFREAAHHTESLPMLARHLDQAVTREFMELAEESRETADIGERFITAAVAEIPAEGGVVRLISRGHCPAFLVTSAGVVTWEPVVPGLPLGLGELDPQEWEFESRPFAEGDLLLLCTDGLLEARSSDGVFYTPQTDLLACRGQGPPAVVGHLVDAVHRHTGRVLKDDMSLMAVAVVRPGAEPEPGATGPARGSARV